MNALTIRLPGSARQTIEKIAKREGGSATPFPAIGEFLRPDRSRAQALAGQDEDAGLKAEFAPVAD